MSDADPAGGRRLRHSHWRPHRAEECRQVAPDRLFLRKLTQAERTYSAFDRELLGIFVAIKHFRAYLDARIFTVWTDHRPLTFALDQKGERPSSRQARALSFISEFTSDIRHIRGDTNLVADALSRVSEVNTIHSTPEINFSQFAEDQSSCDNLRLFQSTAPLHQISASLRCG